MLDQQIFQQLSEKTTPPEVDLFASRLNRQVKNFISWGPDPDYVAVDAFTISWNKWNTTYAFPPFSLIHRAIAKLEGGQAEGIFIVPHWPTAVWYPQMLRLLTRRPILLPRGKRTLQLPHSDAVHPLHRRLQLLAVSLSGKQFRHKDFLTELVNSSVHHGETPTRDSIKRTSRGGIGSVLNDTWIPFMQLWEMS